MLVFLLFAPLLFSTPPLILGGWLLLFLRFGLSGEIIKRTSWLMDPQEDSVARGQNWLILTIGVFILSIMLFVSPFLVSSMQQNENLETYIPGERVLSFGTLVLTFLYSPISLLLTIEAWISLLIYFGLHYLLHRLKVSIDQIQCLKTTIMTALQFLGIVTTLVGFGWWRSLNPARQDAIHNFSLVILNSTTVILTFGLVMVLFISMNKILAVEETVEQHQQLAGKMALMLLLMLVLLSLMGGGLSIWMHYNRDYLPSIGP